MSVTWHGTIDLTAWCFLSQPALLHGGWAQLLSYCLIPRLCLIFCLLSKLYSKKLVYLTFYQTWSLTVIWSQRTRVSWCVNVSKKCTLKVLRIKAWKKISYMLHWKHDQGFIVLRCPRKALLKVWVVLFFLLQQEKHNADRFLHVLEGVHFCSTCGHLSLVYVSDSMKSWEF